MDEIRPARPLKIVALAKQIPVCETMELDSDGRLVRGGEPEDSQMNDYCRRAVAMGHKIARASDGAGNRAGGKADDTVTMTVLTMGPPQAENVIREALIYGADVGILVCDEELAGSDTLATARALAAALEVCGPFDLILCGRNSLDGDTGQVPPQIAQLLGLPFASGVRELTLASETLSLGLEHDDEYVNIEVELPAVISCAERLIDPCKIKDPAQWATADISKMTKLTAGDLREAELVKELQTGELGEKPEDEDWKRMDDSGALWGLEGSPTRVGKTKSLKQNRLQKIFDTSHELKTDKKDESSKETKEGGAGIATEGSEGNKESEEDKRNKRNQLKEQINQCAAILKELLERQNLPANSQKTQSEHTESSNPSNPTDPSAPSTLSTPGEEPHELTALLLLEDANPNHSRELITKAARLVKRVQIIATPDIAYGEPTTAGRTREKNAIMPDDFASGVIDWINFPASHSASFPTCPPDFILAPSTDWGREVAARTAAGLKCGLVGDAIDLYISENQLICLKPAFGGAMAAEIYCTTSPQMATIREGVFPIDYPETAELEYPLVEFPQSSRIRLQNKTQMDDSSKLANAAFVVGIGQGVRPSDIPEIAATTAELGGELAATRKITDQKHLPRARQVGITGHSIAPLIYIALGISGKFNHTVGLSQAGAIIAINTDPDAEIFAASDIGFIGDYREIFYELLKNPKMTAAIKSAS